MGSTTELASVTVLYIYKACDKIRPVHVNHNAKYTIGSFQTLPGEAAGDAAERARVYSEQWSKVKKIIEVW